MICCNTKEKRLSHLNCMYESVCRLTTTDRVTDRGASCVLYLCLFFTDGAGQAGVKRTFPIRVGRVHTLLTHCVVIMVAVYVHALTHGAHSARLTGTGYCTEEVVVVADADGIVGVGAGRLHPHQTCTHSTRLALLRVTVVLGVGLTCR